MQQRPNVQEMARVIDEALRRIEELEHLLGKEILRFQSLVSGLLPLLLNSQPAPEQDLLDGTGTISKGVTNGGSLPDHESHNGKRLTRKGRVDGRSRFDPEKYLKISVMRTLEWAKRYGQGAEAARGRVIARVQDRAKDYGLDSIPASVRAYIESAVQEYE